MNSKFLNKVFHPQYGTGIVLLDNSLINNTLVIKFNSSKEKFTMHTNEVFDSYQEWAERNAPSYHM